MRAVFGVVSLLVVLAVVAWTVRLQLRPVTSSAAQSASGAPPANASPPASAAQQVGRDVDAALRQGAQRNDDAEKAER